MIETSHMTSVHQALHWVLSKPSQQPCEAQNIIYTRSSGCVANTPKVSGLKGLQTFLQLLILWAGTLTGLSWVVLLVLAGLRHASAVSCRQLHGSASGWAVVMRTPGPLALSSSNRSAWASHAGWSGSHDKEQKHARSPQTSESAHVSTSLSAKLSHKASPDEEVKQETSSFWKAIILQRMVNTGKGIIAATFANILHSLYK